MDKFFIEVGETFGFGNCFWTANVVFSNSFLVTKYTEHSPKLLPGCILTESLH